MCKEERARLIRAAVAAILATASVPSGAQQGQQPQQASLEEVVVTAQKRAENVQDVPIAVSVVSGDALEKIDALGAADLAAVIPSVTFNTGTELRDNSIRIRGVGTDVFSSGIEASVATVVDGVVFSQQGSFFNDLGDIQRVEVLRGPQGTLFGKNSSSGVISYVTRNPNRERFEASGSLLGAQDGEYRVNGVISAPLSDTTAYRVAAFYRENDGIVEDARTGETYNSVEAYGLRSKFQWEPNDTMNFLLAADWQEFNSNCCALPTRVASTNPIVPSTGIALGTLNDKVALGGTNLFADQKNYGASLTADFALGEHTLTYIGAYREWSAAGDFDIDQTPAWIVTSNYNTYDSKQNSHELRLASPIYRYVDYVIGLFYYDTEATQFLDRRGTRINLITSVNPDGTVNAPPGSELLLTGTTVTSAENTSVYAQANVRPIDKLTLTAGARFITEDQGLYFDRPQPSPLFGLGAFGPFSADYSDDDSIVKLAASYEWTPGFMTYASYSTGYKSEGIFNSPAASPAALLAQPIDPETSTLYEVGLRSQWFDRKLTLNLTGFQTKFEGYQQQAFDAALGIFVVTNAGDVHSDGVELEFAAVPLPGLTLSGGVTWLDAGYDFKTGPCYPGQTAALGCVGGQQDLTLGEFVNAPEWRYTLLARYERPVGSAATVYGQVNSRWQDEVQFAYNQDPRFKQPSYGIVDLKVGASLSDERYEVAFFVKNLTDEQYVSNVFGMSGSGGGAITNILARDFHRYFGGEVSVKF